MGGRKERAHYGREKHDQYCQFQAEECSHHRHESDHERIDPALRSESDPNCFLYGWQYNPSTSRWGPDPNNCNGLVYWTTSGNLTGPVHSNDSFFVSGNPTFSQAPESYFNSGPSGGGPGAGNFAAEGSVVTKTAWGTASPSGMKGGPKSGTNLQFPATATSIKSQADKAATGSPTGCLYTGPTTITLKVVGGVGKMNVSTQTPTTGNAHLNAGCVGRDPHHGSEPACKRRDLHREQPDLGDRQDHERLRVAVQRRCLGEGHVEGSADHRRRRRRDDHRRRDLQHVPGWH